MSTFRGKRAAKAGDKRGSRGARPNSRHPISGGRTEGSAPPHRPSQRSPHAAGGAPRSTVAPGGSRENLVMGRNCVEEIVKHTPDRLEQVYLAEAGEGGRGNARKDALEESLRKLSVPVRMLPRRELEALVGSDSHQGVVAKLTPRKARNLDDVIEALVEAPYATILALDSVVDPHNTGAILRAAECFGVSAVVWSHNRGAPLGPVVSKVSVGASELLDLVPVSNLHRALEQLKGSGYWLIGAAVGPDSSDLGAFTFPEKSVLVMGSEGDGMHHLIEKTLDFRVQIPMRGHISSLNVSQATAVLLAAIAGQRGGVGAPSSLVDKAE